MTINPWKCPEQEEAGAQIVAEARVAARQAYLGLGLCSKIIAIDNPSLANTLTATAISAFITTMNKAHAVCLADPDEMIEQIGSGKGKEVNISRELLLLSFLVIHHSSGDYEPHDIMRLALADLHKLGHEVPEKLLEWA